MNPSCNKLATATSGSRAVIVLGLIGILALFIGHALALHYVVDDAYISFHYARHFAEGRGLVYNPGQFVEGYTNPLWVLLLAGVHRVWPTLDFLVAARVIGLSLGAATLACLAVFSARRFPTDRCLNLVAGLLLACNSSFVAWAMGGLESTLFSFLILACVLLNDRDRRAGSGWLAVLAASALVLTRADGFVAFALLTFWRLVDDACARRPLRTRANVLWCIVPLAVLGLHVLWRLRYYGLPLPNTSYAKVGLTLDQLIRGIRYVVHYFGTAGGWLFPLLCLLAVSHSPMPGWLRTTLGFVAAWIAYVCFVGGDGLGYYRFMGYIAPLFALAAQEGTRQMAHMARSIQTRWWRPVGLIALLIVAFAGGQQSYAVLAHPDELIAPYNHYDIYFVERCKRAGQWLRTNTPPDAVIAATPAGAIAFYAERHVIDMLGLTDPHIARRPVPRMGKGRAGHEKGDGRYVLDRKPDYILIGNVAVYDRPYEKDDMQRTLCQLSEREIWASPDFHRDYVLESVKVADSGPFQFFSFYRRIK